MPVDSRAVYARWIGRVLDYIDRHLGAELKLETLAGVAHFSPWHFHRLFAALVGETLADHVRRRRLETAAGLLLSRCRKVSDIALEVGFSSTEILSRGFRQHFGMSPSAWRKGGWTERAGRHRAELSKIRQNDRKKHQEVLRRVGHHGVIISPSSGVPAMKVEINNLPAVRVAYFRHVGPYGESGITLAWQRFSAWCEAAGLMTPRRKMFGVSQDNPDITAPEQCRYDCCVAFDGAATGDEHIAIQILSGGLYACGGFVGSGLEIYDAWHRLCAEWLPGSGFECDDRPWFEIYGEDFAMDPETGRFNCLLCIPVRPLIAE